MKWFSFLVMLTLLTAPGIISAEEPDDEYIKIFGMIVRADELNTSGQPDSALAKYREAFNALVIFKKNNPDWNAKVVSFRLNYLSEKITALSQPVAAAAVNVPAPNSPATGPVKLLDAGAEPRKILRIHPKPGDKSTLSMTTKVNMYMEAGNAPGQAMKMPPITMTMDATVKSVSADGDITYELVMGDASVADAPGVMPQVAAAMEVSFKSIKGFSVTGTISSRGLDKGTELKLPAGIAPQTRQSMEQMKESLSNVASLLPEEAVGPGAKWEVKLSPKSQGMTINQTATYQLVSIEGERLNITSTVIQSANNQKIQNPAMPGINMDVTKMTGKATGNTTFDLAQLLPSQATVDSHSEISMSINADGQKQMTTTKTDLNLQMETK